MVGILSQIQVDSMHRDSNRDGSQGTRAPLLEVDHLTVSFAGKRKQKIKAVDDVSFTIAESESVSVVGQSGSGKTTLGRCIMNLVKPSSGSIRFNGVNVSDLKGRGLLDYWKNVQMVYQDPYESLDPGQDVFTTIAIPIRRLTGEKEASRVSARVNELLHEVGLEPEQVLYRYPHQLSGGEKQRVSICRALAANPKLLIADEPITMLDASQRLNILRLLVDLKAKRNLVFLLITHDLNSAVLATKRTMVMYQGKFVETGDSHTVFTQPHDPYVKLILKSTPTLERSLFEDEAGST
jgi:peptide/nickel transport system ATP-binding protein